MKKRKVIIDCDPGIDDSLAIMLALKSPEIEVIGITIVCGNSPVEMGFGNAKKILKQMNRLDVPVYIGESTPLRRDYVNALDTHGEDGLGESFLPEVTGYQQQISAVDFLADILKKEKVSIIELAVKAGREVRFMDCARLVDDLKDAQARGILKKRLKYYAHSKLLIIDELGYLDIDEGGADLLFQLVSTRYEQRSTIITTNVGIGGWAKVFGDEVAASAIADRVCHHCSMIKITGRSYRLKDLPAEKRREE